MPQINNIVLKNKAGTDVTATVLSPSAGDSSAAKWRIETAAVPMARPSLELITKANRTGTVRRAIGRIRVPYAVVNPSTGLTQVVNTPAFSFEVLVGQDVPTANHEDFVAYATSFLNSPLVKASLESMIAPT